MAAGFSYVSIPADPHEPMKELRFEGTVTLEKDEFVASLKRFFAAQDKEVDKEILLKSMSQHTGRDLKNEEGLDPAFLERCMHETSIDIFPVMLPMPQFGNEGVSLYCDDKGVAKELPLNPRAMGLVKACGYEGQQFRGDIFLGRMFDDGDEEWRRIDFTVADCSSDAPWVALTQKQRSGKKASDVHSLGSSLGKLGGGGAGVGGGGGPQVVAPGMFGAGGGGDEDGPVETESYSWRQTGDEVEITFKSPPEGEPEGNGRVVLRKEDKKLVKVSFSRGAIKVVAKGETLLDAPLCQPCQPDECTWTLSDGVLQLTVAKASDGQWKSLLKV